MKIRRLERLAVALAAGTVLLGGCGLVVSANNSATVPSESVAPTITSSIPSASTVPAGTKWRISAEPGWTMTVTGVEGKLKAAPSSTPTPSTPTPSTPGAKSTARPTASATPSVTATAAPSSAEWVSAPLPPGRQLTANVLVENALGDQYQQAFTITTAASKNRYSMEFSGDSKQKYGVGQMPTIEFSIPIPKKSRKAVTSHLATQVTPKNVGVQFRWIDDQRVAYRPREFWPGRSKITVGGDLSDVPISYDGDLYWGKAQTFRWRTGNHMVISINANGPDGVVRINGKRALTFGVSLGKPGYTTRSGIKTITDKHTVTRMTNIGVTDDEVYDLQVPYAMRLTDTGEFLHAAPWNGNIGYANTSHGCSNLSTSTASWIFSRAEWGTPVVTTGTGRPMETWNGPGAMWNIPWKQWAN